MYCEGTVLSMPQAWAVAAHIEVEAGMPVVVEGAKRHVTGHGEAKPLSNSLNGECSELLKFGISNF